MADQSDSRERLESLKRELSTLRYDGVSNYTEEGKARVRQLESEIKQMEKESE